MKASNPRPEYPRPQMARADWLCLNGPWEFAFDESGEIDVEAVLAGEKLDGEIVVPFTFESPLSGIGDTSYHTRVWYARDVEVPASWASRRVLIHFGAVDYSATVWVNGREIGSHSGGQVPFSFDITDYLNGSRARIVVGVEDSPSVAQPRGKQSLRTKSFSSYYTRTTGIWQTVWLEPVGSTYIRSVALRPDIERSVLRVEAVIRGVRNPQLLQVAAVFKGEQISTATAQIGSGAVSLTVPIPECRLWTPEEPSLYDLQIEIVEDGAAVDSVKSYAGMREVSVKDGKFCLNGKPYFQKLVLDQGYWPDGILTAPSDDAFKTDIELAKSFGFNGARKHQKVEDPRYHYWADRLGFLVWGETANARRWDPAREEAFTAEWLAAVRRDANHPSIVVWTPFNESWGIQGVARDPRVRAFVENTVARTRAADPTRPVNDNDGWEHTAATDLLTIHDYEKEGHKLLERWKDFEGKADSIVPAAHRESLAGGVEYGGWPFLLTEYGGIAFAAGGAVNEAWGYHGVETTEEGFLERFRNLHEAIYAIGSLQGFCYTQLTDVEQEINGLTTFDRRPKIDPAQIAPTVGGRQHAGGG
ncbi:MAG: glycoside hydrolase family 2 [Planctomycetes bacterium]|nr:glycoside hydrolase family 2 [Planctomycetota bacterium]